MTAPDLRHLCPLLEVFDIRASLSFYRDLLGFEIIEAAPPPAEVRDDEFGWVWLRRGDIHLMLNSAFEHPAERPPAADPLRAAAHGDTILYFGAPDVDAVYRFLRGRGLELEPPKDAPYGMRQLYLSDPDGFGICFQWPVEARPPKGEPRPVTVRAATAADAARWGTLRAALWPEESPSGLAAEAEACFREGVRGLEAVFVAESAGKIVGFAEVGTRAYAEGCETSPVGFLEGWYVVPEHRGQGVGRRLVDAAIAWARERGLAEFASDALYDNGVSRAAHRALGFEEVEAIRCFRMAIDGPA